MNHKMTIIFTRYIDGELRQFMATGRVAQTLYYLVQAGDKGITALEISIWALRLSAYIYNLRHDYGMDIQSLSEPHDGGRHARYVLHTSVEIIEAYPT